jgi:hypothetical protein
MVMKKKKEPTQTNALAKQCNGSGVVEFSPSSPVVVPPIEHKARSRFFQKLKLSKKLENIRHDTEIKKIGTEIIQASAENHSAKTDGTIALRQARTMRKVDDARLTVASAECKAIESGINEKLRRLSFGG